MRWLAGVGCLVALCGCPVDPGAALDAGFDAGGCGPGAFEAATGACTAVGHAVCGPGFTAAPGGWGCAPDRDGPCAAGSLGVPGEACTPIGWATCPQGFARDPSGWSCEPVLPAAPCTGATRAALGSGTCVPVGDCAAPFPPAAATLFVDASFDAGALDATHFGRIADALAAAPAGATVAIAPGTYAESLAPPRAVKLVGRCAAQVRLSGNPALALVGVQGVEVEGVTVRDSTLAARLETGAGLTLRHAVLEANRRSGIQALDADTTLTLEDVVIRGTLADPATQTFGQGLAASYGARVTLTDVELSGNREAGLFLDRAGTRATLTRAVVTGTLPRASTGRLGWGIAVQGGALLEGASLVVRDHRVTALLVAQPGSSATLTDAALGRSALGIDNQGNPAALVASVLAGGALTWTGGAAEDAALGLVFVDDPGSSATLRNLTARGVSGPATPATFGLSAQAASSSLTLERVAVLNVAGAGVLALDGAQVTMDHVGVFDTSGPGLRAQGAARVVGAAVEVRRHGEAAALATVQGSLKLTGCVLADAVAAPDGGPGGYGAAAQEQASITLERCLVDANVGAGVYASSAGTQVSVLSSVVRGTRLDGNGEYGQGVVAERGGSADLLDVSVLRNHTAGVQVADAPSLLSLSRVTVGATQPNAGGTRGRGANAAFGGALVGAACAFVDNQQVGVFAFQSSVRLTDSLVRGTRADPDGRFGNGLEILTDAAIAFTGGALEDSAGLGAVWAEGAGVLDGARLARNPVALHAQDGSAIEELASAPSVLGPRQVVVTSSTAFAENGVRVSAGSVPVPPR